MPNSVMIKGQANKVRVRIRIRIRVRVKFRVRVRVSRNRSHLATEKGLAKIHVKSLK